MALIEDRKDREQRVLFGQRRAGPRFSTNEEVPEHQSGRTLNGVAAELMAGTLTSDDIAIFAFRYQGKLVSANTRGLATLSKAGMKPTNITIITPSPSYLRRLREVSVLGDTLPSTRIAITPSITDTRVLEVVSIPD